ncbi:MAG: RluA family pseudouridine synthase [Clostridia bacterium]
MELIFEVENEMSINEILNKKLNISARLKSKLIKNKLVLLNGTFVDTRNIAHFGDIVTIDLSYPEDNSNIVSKKMDLQIIYEDKHLLAINKHAGIPVHPSILHFDDSLASGVKYYFDRIGLKKKIRAVNRIDLNTSGLVLFAKNEYIQECLIKQMKKSSFKKTYLAIVHGHIKEKSGIINAPIGRKENSIIARCILSEGQKAITHYEVLQEFDKYSLVKCIIETGRTHQIRVHMAYIGNPLIGDTLYNPNENLEIIKRHALHSYKMEFIHPISKKIISLEAELPEDMKKIISH